MPPLQKSGIPHPDDFTIEWNQRPYGFISNVRVTRGKALYRLPRWKRWLMLWRRFRVQQRDWPTVPLPANHHNGNDL